MTGALARRIAFTLGALLVYRLGLAIPLPGIDPRVWAAIFPPDAGSFGTSLFLSGTHQRLGIFALGILPYVTAAVLIQIAALFSRRLRARAQSERGRRSIVVATRYLTILLASFQGWGVANGLEQLRGVVPNPGGLFIATTIVSLAAGTLFLAWLAEQMTLRGIGNGIALILVAGSGLQLPVVIARILEGARMGASMKEVAGLLLIVVAVTALIVWIELARRRIPIQFPNAAGGAKLHARPSYLSIKLNPAGIIPVLLAGWLIGLVIAAATLAGADDKHWLIAGLAPGTWTYLVISAALIVFCTFFYTAFVLDPEAAAERLNRLSGVIPGVHPGEATAGYIDQAVSRAAMIGAVYLALVSLLPIVLAQLMSAALVLGGTTLLIVVCTMLDLAEQIRAEWRRPETVGDSGD